MALLKRIFFFSLINIGILLTIQILLLILNNFFGINISHTSNLFLYALMIGFTGSFISLFLSKFLVKRSYNIYLLKENELNNDFEKWYYNTTTKLAKKLNINNLEIGIYEGDANAFATGWSKNNALIALSSELIKNCELDELEAIIGHELSHIENGDMVTMTLLQGVLNTFVIYFSRMIGGFIDKAIFKSDSNNGIGYILTTIVLDILFGLIASIIMAAFSRHREYKADAGSASLTTKYKMINALRKLNNIKTGELDKNLSMAGISGNSIFLGLFSTHPSIDDRINYLNTL